METDGSTCPEDSNSTDCLLRTLLQLINENRNADDAKTDWDPITFAFTAVIGVVAIIFAFIPIIQTLLAAGRGRRKTSSRAIGEWSKKREWNWNGDEWTIEFTAWTPVITETSLQRAIQSKQKDHKKKTKPVSRKESAASWLEFFQRVGLDKIPMPDNHEGLRSVVPDYLPDDLVAAPAYAQVGVIVSAATMAGALVSSVDKQTNYPLLRGFNFQFDFRQHPLLGIVGAYSQYDHVPGEGDSMIATVDELHTSLRQAEGWVRAGRQQGVTVSQGEEKSVPAGTEMNIFGDNSRFAMYTIQDTMRRSNQHFLLSVAKKLSREHHEPVTILFLTTSLKRAPELFPNSELTYMHWLAIVALNTKYWANAPLDDFSKATLTDWPETVEIPNWFPFWHRMSTSEMASVSKGGSKFDDFLTRQKQRFAEDTAGNSTSGHLVVLQMCMKMLHDPADFRWWFAISDLRTRQYLRWLAFEQLKILDAWLEAKPRENVDARWSLLCITTMSLSQADKSTRKGLFKKWQQADQANTFRDTARSRHLTMLGTICRFLDDMGLDDADKAVESHHLKRRSDFELLQTTNLDEEGREGLLAELKEKAPFQSSAKFQSFSRKVSERRLILAELGCSFYYDEDGEWAYIYDMHRLLLRLRAVASLENEASADEATLDNMVVFRCLVVALLFRTAVDSGPILKSGLWEHVVPIL